LSATILSGCVKDNQAIDTRISSPSCPWFPEDIRREAKRYTAIPAENLTKSDVLKLIRALQISEEKKNLYLQRAERLYVACISTLKKGK